MAVGHTMKQTVRVAREPLAIDFDGVIHAYNHGWQGGKIYDDPVEGTKHALRLLSTKYRLVVFTARYNLDDVRKWLRKEHLDHYFEDVTNRKPGAIAYIDDRAYHFTSWAETLRHFM